MKKIPLEQFLKNCIETMRNAGIVDMEYVQYHIGIDSKVIKTSTEELHLCNTPACFRGWVAVSDWWKELGGDVDTSFGEPIISGYTGCSAMASVIDDEDFTLMSAYIEDISDCDNFVFPDLQPRHIRAEHVIEVLQRWLDTGSPRLSD